MLSKLGPSEVDSEMITIKVKTPTGQAIENVTVHPHDKVDELKSQCKVVGIFPEEAIVFEFNEKKLENEETYE